MSAQDFVEANSLSGLTQLAGNPPKYPRNPTEQKRANLVLYIARVPGSNDIILTTLKPQLKSVTSEDIASSLYYLHLNSDDDAQLLAEVQPVPSRALSRKTLARKPLPDGSRAQSLDIDRRAVLSPERSRRQENALDIQKEDTSGQDTVLNPRDNFTNTPMVAKAGTSRRPVGQRPLAHSNTLTRRPLPNSTSQSSILTAGSSQIGSSNHNNLETSQRPPSSHTMFERPKPSDDLAKAFSITIIRRDPSSGGQWNVGIVEGKSNPPTGAMTATKKPYYNISVHITTPGYNFFRHNTHAIGKIKLPGTTLNRELQEANSKHPGNEGSTSVAQKYGVSGSGFHREVSMEWASSWNQTFRQHKKTLSDFSVSHSRNSSASSDGPQQFESDNRPTEGPENSRAKGYTFLSPWGGTCTFSTGGAGRSLRCRHRLPAPVSADALTSSSSWVTVSELRFNLPSSDLFDKEKMDLAAAQVKSGPSKLTRKLGSFRKKLSTATPQRPSETQPRRRSRSTIRAADGEDLPSLPPRPSSISSSYEEDSPPLTRRLHGCLDELTISNDNDDRLDLSIGQEKAGGGNKGKRAKLGKLIIHDEGLKMLDLIVAANIGVWWTVWNPN
ncbi:hypothetical protein DSL72_000995 [Monilinia vaccinii-corymbosi]|uniref:Oxidoreductase-like protein n=1 Tax=Monilinia vaccinii-corymbosi TaxID=61207 RepID=A0A8A3P411_9HELO|nr:hypothetical protein DSL72_000995 [Monilinia vaccinii-corymbosi]